MTVAATVISIRVRSGTTRGSVPLSPPPHAQSTRTHTHNIHLICSTSRRIPSVHEKPVHIGASRRITTDTTRTSTVPRLGPLASALALCPNEKKRSFGRLAQEQRAECAAVREVTTRERHPSPGAFVVTSQFSSTSERAGDRTRTGDVQLGKLAFYQLNYAREVGTSVPAPKWKSSNPLEGSEGVHRTLTRPRFWGVLRARGARARARITRRQSFDCKGML